MSGREKRKLPELADLTDEQQAVVESWGRGLAVQAGAGSGKTTTLVLKCAELLKRKSDARFCAVSFTERSASDLRAKLSERLSLNGEGGALSGHWVMTIHGLCGAIIREYPREAGYDGEETMLSEPEAQILWERAIDSLWQDDLPEDVQAAFDALLRRESRNDLYGLLRRVRDLHSFNVLHSLAASADPGSVALERLGRHVIERYDRLKRRRGALDFNDLERGADEVLKSAAVREAFQRRFDLVMVDEFQDTNPVQARIIERFIRPDRSNLVVVGDPKQSIYRFRDADVGVFERFCRELPVNLSLTWNFRSRPGIIQFANEVCEKAFASSEMNYIGLVPKREARADIAPVERIDVREPAELARWVLAEAARGVPLHEMALLLRKIRGGNEKWLKALTTAGIPIAVGSGGFFWEDPRIRELASLLQWWDNPSHSLAGAVFLRAPWVGVPDGVIDSWLKTDPTLLGPFFARTGLVPGSAADRLSRALEPHRSRLARPGELLLALLLDEAIENEIGVPLLGLWHRLENLSSRGLDFHAAVGELRTSIEQNRREREVPPPRNQGQLSVLTIHGSKGLEFPHVILVDLGKKPRATPAPLLFWDRFDGAYLAPRDTEGNRYSSAKKDPVESAWCLLEKKKDLAESKRVFYVALTRAQERLALVCPELEGAEFPTDPEGAKQVYAEDDWRAWIECSGAAPAGAPAPQALSVPGNVNTPALPDALKPRAAAAGSWPAVLRKRTRHSVTEWTMLSRCPRAYEWTYIRPVAPVGFDGQGGAMESAELTQRELGTRVHACLERGDWDALRALEHEAGEDRFQSEPVIRWAQAGEWMAPPDGAADRDVWTEVGFEVPIDDEVLVGSIDRLVREKGKYSIIDFKVTAKPKSEGALVEAYGSQLALYAWALGKLEPEAPSRITALLVNISARAIQTVPVPVREFPAAETAARSRAIVAGAPGAPTPGELCRVCQFRGRCPEGARAPIP